MRIKIKTHFESFEAKLLILTLILGLLLSAAWSSFSFLAFSAGAFLGGLNLFMIRKYSQSVISSASGEEGSSFWVFLFFVKIPLLLAILAWIFLRSRLDTPSFLLGLFLYVIALIWQGTTRAGFNSKK